MFETAMFLDLMEGLAKRIVRINKEHGFYDENPNVGEMIALIHSELSEALEEFRIEGSNPAEVRYKDFQGVMHANQNLPEEHRKPEGMGIELADAVIRIMHLAQRLNIDLGRAIVEKVSYNETRPFKHGGKKF